MQLNFEGRQGQARIDISPAGCFLCSRRIGTI